MARTCTHVPTKYKHAYAYHRTYHIHNRHGNRNKNEGKNDALQGTDEQVTYQSDPEKCGCLVGVIFRSPIRQSDADAKANGGRSEDENSKVIIHEAAKACAAVLLLLRNRSSVGILFVHDAAIFLVFVTVRHGKSVPEDD